MNTMNNATMSRERFWYALATALDRIALILGSISHTADAAAKQLAAVVEKLKGFATWARFRAKRLPVWAKLAGDEWKEALVPPREPEMLVPLAREMLPAQPPPIPAIARLEKPR